MKKLVLIPFLFFTFIANAQTTAIPDANFEQALINLGFDAGSPDGVVPTANVDTIISLYIWAKNISDLTGIQDFNALVELNCEANQFASIDVSQNLNLKVLVTANNFQLTNLDVSQNTSLTYLNCAASPNLSSIDVRNGNNVNFTYFNAQVDSSLKCIYVDDKNATYLSSWIKDTSAHWVNDTLDCQNIVTVNELKNLTSVNIFPNPIINENITVVFGEILEKPEILIKNNLGQEVYHRKYDNTTSIDLKLKLSSGIYYMDVISKREIITKKIIKQ